MPALQVRDFPDDLYEKLKFCASRNHRSMAQQTIAYVEQGMMLEDGGEYYWDGRKFYRPVRSNIVDFDTERERKERIEKRKALFAKIEEEAKNNPLPQITSDDILEAVHEGRRERDRQISDLLGLPYDEEL